MIANREDYHYVTGDILAKDAHDPQKYTVTIDGTSMGGAEQGSVRRLIPRGEDICWLYEAFTARAAFLGDSLGIATLSFDDGDGGTLDGVTSVTPYEFLRCRPYPMPQPVDARAKLEEPRRIVDAYNMCLWGARFINPGPPFNPSQVINRHSTDRSGLPKDFLWDKRYDPQNGYSLEKLPLSPCLPKVVGERLASVESRMDWFKYGLRSTAYGDQRDYSALGFNGSVTGYGQYHPTPLPDIEAYRNQGYTSFYSCHGFHSKDRGANYYVVKGDAPNRLKLMACKVRDWITSVRPVYLLDYYYYHYDAEKTDADTGYYSGRGVTSPARAYQIDSDGYVTLQVQSDIQAWNPSRKYGGNIGPLVPGSTSGPNEYQYIHDWSIRLVGVELIATFDDAICNC